MELGKYLQKHKISQSAFAEQVGTRQSAIWAYVHKRKQPRPVMIAKIIRATDGAVTPNDFYDVSINSVFRRVYSK